MPDPKVGVEEPGREAERFEGRRGEDTCRGMAVGAEGREYRG